VKGTAIPERLLLVPVLVGVVGGAIFGFVRGLHYTPTLPFAVVEGAILFGVPACILGLLLAAGWSLGAIVHRHFP
jgi:uncharacterized membrane protein YsdA (DUF1294 family)